MRETDSKREYGNGGRGQQDHKSSRACGMDMSRLRKRLIPVDERLPV